MENELGCDSSNFNYPSKIGSNYSIEELLKLVRLEPEEAPSMRTSHSIRNQSQSSRKCSVELGSKFRIDKNGLREMEFHRTDFCKTFNTDARPTINSKNKSSSTMKTSRNIDLSSNIQCTNINVKSSENDGIYLKSEAKHLQNASLHEEHLSVERPSLCTIRRKYHESDFELSSSADVNLTQDQRSRVFCWALLLRMLPLVLLILPLVSAERKLGR